jgi:hypothetical protein
LGGPSEDGQLLQAVGGQLLHSDGAEIGSSVRLAVRTLNAFNHRTPALAQEDKTRIDLGRG